jgi:hypothetical protein
MEKRLELMGEQIDKIVRLDINCRGSADVIYEAARKRMKGPLAFSVAERLKETISRGDFVFIATGAPITYGVTETDGPIGASALARALDIGLGAKSILLTEKSLMKQIAGACRGGGMTETNVEELLRKRDRPLHAVCIKEVSVIEEEAKQEAERLIAQLKPKAIIAVELCSKNEKGIYHNASGTAKPSEQMAKIDHFFTQGNSQGILTIGIGDYGNEVGLGSIRDTIKQYIPNGAMCTCPCKGGVASGTDAELVVAGSISNWGAYGIAACLAAILNRMEVFHTGRIEQRMMEECVNEGAMDAGGSFCEPAADQISSDIHGYIVELMRVIVRKGLKGYEESRGLPVWGVPF